MPDDLGTALDRIARDVDPDEGWATLQRRLAGHRRRRMLVAGAGVVVAVALVAATAAAVNSGDDEVEVATGPATDDSPCAADLGFPMSDSSPPDAPFTLVLNVDTAEPGDLVDVELVVPPERQPQDPSWSEDWELQRWSGRIWTSTHILLNTIRGPSSWVSIEASRVIQPYGSGPGSGQAVVPPVEAGWHRIVARAADHSAADPGTYDLHAYLLLGCFSASPAVDAPPLPDLQPWTGSGVEVAWLCGERFALGLQYPSLGDAPYIRDPSGLLAGTPSLSTFDPDIELPVDAESTGDNSGDIELWTVPGVDRHVYLVMPDRVERWPRLAHQLLCE